MNVVRTIAEARAAVSAARAAGRRIGLVPTMGALHAGHVSLIDAARRDGLFAVVSIFVNPAQFGPNEDFARYPRDEEGDLRACRAAGVELVFAPSAAEMYPRADLRESDFAGGLTTIRVRKLTDTLCGPFRPGHFDGVALVVAKLLKIVTPDRAYFGRKDAQQLAVIRRMVADLNMATEIVGCPIVREADGLALSSRNAYLSADERRRALSLCAALREAGTRIGAGERDAGAIERGMFQTLSAAAPTKIDYASVVDALTLQPVATIDRAVLVAVAVYFGRTRLIDNLECAGAATG